jgi:N-acetylneuraminic acid mutarotase
MRIRRVLWWFARVLIVVVVGLLIAVVILRLTNPRPSDSIGWRQKAPMPDTRGETASAVVGKRLVVVGGLSGVASTSRATSVYNPTFDAWLRGEPLPRPRHHAAASAWGRYVYLSGGAPGATDWTAKSDVWRSRPGERWRRLAPMPEGRQGHAMVAHDDKLYVIGGVGDSDDTLIYDIASDSWTRGAPLPRGRDHLRAVVWNGDIWAIGGRAGSVSDRIDVYSPRGDRWIRGPALPVGMSAMAVGVIANDLHVIGGEDPRFFRGGVLQHHFMLRADEERWQARPKAMLAVHGAGYGVIDRTLYIAAGASRQGALSVLSWTNVTQSYTVRSQREIARD